MHTKLEIGRDDANSSLAGVERDLPGPSTTRGASHCCRGNQLYRALIPASSPKSCFCMSQVDQVYYPQLEVVGDVGNTIWRLTEAIKSPPESWDLRCALNTCQDLWALNKQIYLEINHFCTCILPCTRTSINQPPQRVHFHHSINAAQLHSAHQ